MQAAARWMGRGGFRGTELLQKRRSGATPAGLTTRPQRRQLTLSMFRWALLQTTRESASCTLYVDIWHVARLMLRAALQLINLMLSARYGAARVC